MKKYWLVIKLAAKDLFQYKFDFFLHTVKYSLMVLMMSVVWLQVEKDGNVGLLSSQETISYFLMSAMLYTLSNFHPVYIEEDIRLGYLSKFLVKPMSPTIYYFCFEFSRVLIETLIKIVVFLSILFALHLLPNLTWFQIAVLLLYSPLVYTFAFEWLTLISLLAFWITEAYAVRWAVTIFTRLLSGVLVPLVYFPAAVQTLLFFLPFQHLAFSPIQFMLGKTSLFTLGLGTLVLLFWTLVLGIFRQLVWKFGLNNYEGTGI